MKRGIVCALACAGWIASVGMGHAAESAYTDLKLDGCKTLVEPNPDEPGGDFTSILCPGLGKYKVLFKEGDLRQSLHYGYLSKYIRDEAFESFGYFNNVNLKIEWRVGAGGKPYAAIQRFFIGDSLDENGVANPKNVGQVLAISRVGQPDDEEGCVAGYVDALANPDANQMAREVADDIAPSFRCGVDKPEYHGIKGEKAGDPMINHLEQ